MWCFKEHPCCFGMRGVECNSCNSSSPYRDRGHCPQKGHYSREGARLLQSLSTHLYPCTLQDVASIRWAAHSKSTYCVYVLWLRLPMRCKLQAMEWRRAQVCKSPAISPSSGFRRPIPARGLSSGRWASWKQKGSQELFSSASTQGRTHGCRRRTLKAY